MPTRKVAAVRWHGGDPLGPRPVVTAPPHERTDHRGRVVPLPLEDHLTCALIEDCLWLCSPPGGNLRLAHACERLGVSVDQMEQSMRRWGIPVPANYVIHDGVIADASVAYLVARRRKAEE